MKGPDIKEILKESGFKATPGRLALLELLSHEHKPLSVEAVAKRLKGTLNEVTLYRALEAFTKAGLVRRVDLGHDHAHYEILVNRGHHDHVVCTKCGAVEDVEGCALVPLQKTALKQSHFKSIYSHNLEFFGVCRTCLK